mmetsp:Transcript_5242/g.32975  ORF Transcript_5242/g.32975 Transcript_5242/m.32975 type:complete len:91 (-) Transcript_5242:64-336(-)
MDEDRLDERGREAGRHTCGVADDETMEQIDANRCVESTTKRYAARKEGAVHECIRMEATLRVSCIETRNKMPRMCLVRRSKCLANANPIE